MTTAQEALSAVLRRIADRADEALTHMDDAARFGWTDRYQDAQECVTDALLLAGELAERGGDAEVQPGDRYFFPMLWEARARPCP